MSTDTTTGQLQVLVIPVTGPIEFHELPRHDNLGKLQELVGGYIEAVPLPDFITGADAATSYVNEEGKLIGAEANMRATDYMVPGIGIFFGDYIAGPFVLAGFDPSTGEHAALPETVIRRAKLIEREAG